MFEQRLEGTLLRFLGLPYAISSSPVPYPTNSSCLHTPELCPLPLPIRARLPLSVQESLCRRLESIPKEKLVGSGAHLQALFSQQTVQTAQDPHS